LYNNDLTSLNDKTSFFATYNANTDRNVDQNRINVMDYLRTNYKHGIFNVRYALGYYYMYVMSSYAADASTAVVLEITQAGYLVIWVYSSNSWTRVRTLPA